MSDDDRRAQGIELARRLFEGAPRNPNRMPKQFTDDTMGHLFGDLWQRDDLTLEERSLVTCTILVALNRENEQRLHFRAANNLGIARSTIVGMIMQAAHYAGWPCAASALNVLAEVWPDDEA